MLKPVCEICRKNYTAKGLSRHLQSCLPKHLGTSSRNTNEKTFYLNVSVPYNPDYFLHLAVTGTTTLKELDSYLRDIWLECCGHMSQFAYGSAYGDEINMNRKIHQVLESGGMLSYVYDFGDSTELTIRVMGVSPGILRENKNIYLLARNIQPDIPCDECGKGAAKIICTECAWDPDSGWLCEDCAKDHECDEDMFLDVVNSPRTGVCGYNG